MNSALGRFFRKEKFASFASASLRKPYGQPFRQSGGNNFLLRSRNIIRNAVEGYGVFAGVIERKRRARIAVPGLADRTWIDQVLGRFRQMKTEMLFAFGRSILGFDDAFFFVRVVNPVPSLNVCVAKKDEGSGGPGQNGVSVAVHQDVFVLIAG